MRPPNPLPKKARQVGFIRTIQNTAGNIGHRFVIQYNHASQIILEVLELATIFEQALKCRTMFSNNWSRFHDW
jgi:hypothetical protein